MLAKCQFCGSTNCRPHKKYADRCEECGKRYTKYSSYKSLQRSDPNEKRARKLDQIVDEYKELKWLGYKVPHDIK